MHNYVKNITNIIPAHDPNSLQGSPKVFPDFAWTARHLLTVTETLFPPCAPHLDYWNPKAKVVGAQKPQYKSTLVGSHSNL